mgnify:CR=1 FL=1
MNPPSRRSILSAVSVTALTGILTACGSGTGARKASAGASGGTGDLVIGLTYTPNIQFAPAYLALRNGDYAANVALRHHGAQEGLFDALLAGTEHAVVAGGDEAAVAASNGRELVVIGGYYQRYPVQVIVSQDSPVTTLADLRGRTVGLPGRSGETWYGLRLALDTAGLSQDDVTVQETGYTQVSALMTGKVDAIVGFSNNDAVQLGQAGFPVRGLDVAQTVPLLGASIVTSASVLAARRAELADAVVATARGMSAFVEDPDAAVEAARAYVPDLVDATQAAHAREVAVATAALIKPDEGSVIGALDRELVTSMVSFLGSHQLLGDTAVTPETICDPLLTV